MVNSILLKMIHLPITLRIRFSSYFNRWFFKAKGAKIGKDFNVIGSVSIFGPGKISVGDNFCMTNGCAINPISSNLNGTFYTDSSEAQIIIGNNVGMSSTRMWIHDRLIIGNNVKIGGGVLLIDTDCHPMNYEVRRTSNAGTESAPIVIEDDVWVGAQSIILKGVTIGARSIIGAGSVVTKDIPADCIAAGNPCKVIRMINQ